ncbi:unnamed protein product [Urochloa decumbens]|uniref:Serinc-domain containing serine and sphingolipid biosynthesis protein n=1 Tax=Urochloa decumbens TaxID=240449 RepID=A0ABC8VE42_9POAL
MSTEIVHTGVIQIDRDDGRGNGYREDSLCHRFCQGPSPMFARYIYSLLFLLANFLAWAVRENHITFFQGQRLNGCLGNRDCLEAEVVMTISLTSFIHDQRNLWHSQWWIAKGVLLTGTFILSKLVPSYWIQLYGEVAHYGAGVMRLITRFNYKWCQTNFENHYLKVITVSIIAYNSSMVGITLMAMWYTAYWINIAFIGTTLLVVYLLPLIPLMLLKSKAKGFYMEPGLVGLYIVFQCYLAIQSEPETSCYKKGNDGSGAYWKNMLSFVAELIVTAYDTFSTGNDYKCVWLTNIGESEDDVPYHYGVFHFVFAMGSMYFGMLFVGWNTHRVREDKWSVDVSWTSTWIHIVNEGLTVISFVAIVVARIYGIGWLRQLLGRVFGLGGQQQQSEMGHDDEEGIRGPPSSPLVSVSSQATTTEEEEEELEILSWCSNDTIDTGPPPSPVLFPKTATHQAQEIIISAEMLTTAINVVDSSSSREAS